MQPFAVVEGMLVLNNFRKWCSNLNCFKSSSTPEKDEESIPAMVQIRSDEIKEEKRVSTLTKKSTATDFKPIKTASQPPSTLHSHSPPPKPLSATTSSTLQTSHTLKSSKTLTKRSTTNLPPHASQPDSELPSTRPNPRSSRLKSHEQENPFHDKFSIPDTVNMATGLISAGGAVVGSAAAVKTMKYMRGGNERGLENERDLELGIAAPNRQVSATMSTASTVVEAGNSGSTLRGMDRSSAGIGSKVGRDTRGGDKLIWTGMR
ncbi:MAG: hypothetical protein M1812_006571 [Candelaria pacifica]|nr:MAG: hypothetical protein M1812_006571 [Candelaria pacifica]